MTVTAPLSLDHFLAGGFDLRQQLGAHLSLSAAELERQLPLATEALAPTNRFRCRNKIKFRYAFTSKLGNSLKHSSLNLSTMGHLFLFPG